MDDHRKQYLRYHAEQVDVALSLILPTIVRIVRQRGYPSVGRIQTMDPVLASDIRIALNTTGGVVIGPGAEGDRASIAIGPETICHGGKVSIDMDWIRDELKRIHGGRV